MSASLPSPSSVSWSTTSTKSNRWATCPTVNLSLYLAQNPAHTASLLWWQIREPRKNPAMCGSATARSSAAKFNGESGRKMQVEHCLRCTFNVIAPPL